MAISSHRTRISGGHAVRRLVLALGLAVSALLLVAGPASAHAELERSDPADGVDLEVAPSQVRLNFTESVELGRTRVVLTSDAGRDLAAGSITRVLGAATDEPRSTESPSSLVVAMPSLSSGSYRLAWSTVSSDDLHATSGVLVFGVRTSVSAATRTSASSPAPSVGESALRWISLLALAAAAGGQLLARLLTADRVGQRLPLLRRAGRLSLAGAAAVVLADAALLAVQAGGPAAVPAVLGSGRYGVHWVTMQAASLILVAVAASAVSRARAARAVGPRWFAAGAAALVTHVVAAQLTGHVAAGARRSGLGPGARTALGAIHVLAATVWVGLLVAVVLVLVSRRAPDGGVLRRTVLRRFSALAVGCVATMVVTGLVLAGVEVASVDALLVSGYGRVLLVKVAVVAVAVLLGALNASGSSRLPRALGGGRHGARLLVLEAAAAVLVLGGAAALASSQPAVGRQWRAPTPVQPIVSGTAADLVEAMSISPNRPGPTFVAVDVFDSRRPSPAPVTGVRLTLRSEDGVQTTTPALDQGAGRWLLTTDAVRSPGRWSVRVDVDRPGLPVASATYPWTVPGPGGRLDRTIVSSSRLAGPLDALAAGLLVVGAGAVGSASLLRRRRRSRIVVHAPVEPTAARTPHLAGDRS